MCPYKEVSIQNTANISGTRNGCLKPFYLTSLYRAGQGGLLIDLDAQPANTGFN